jgi:hypothetical protein
MERFDCERETRATASEQFRQRSGWSTGRVTVIEPPDEQDQVELYVEGTGSRLVYVNDIENHFTLEGE